MAGRDKYYLADKTDAVLDASEVDDLVVIAKGSAVSTTKAAHVADAAVITAFTPPATGGSVTVVSESEDDLDTVAAALDNLVSEVTALRATVNSIIGALEVNHMETS